MVNSAVTMLQVKDSMHSITQHTEHRTGTEDELAAARVVKVDQLSDALRHVMSQVGKRGAKRSERRDVAQQQNRRIDHDEGLVTHAQRRHAV